MKCSLIHNLIAFLAAVAVAVGSAVVLALNEPLPTSFYKPDLLHEVAQEMKTDSAFLTFSRQEK